MNLHRGRHKKHSSPKKNDIYHIHISFFFSLILRDDKCIVCFAGAMGIERDHFIDRDVLRWDCEKKRYAQRLWQNERIRGWLGRRKGRTDFTRQFLPCCRSDGEGDGGVRRSGVPLFSFPLRPVCVKAAFPRCQAVCGYAVLRGAARVSTLWNVAIWLGKYGKYLFKRVTRMWKFIWKKNVGVAGKKNIAEFIFNDARQKRGAIISPLKLDSPLRKVIYKFQRYRFNSKFSIRLMRLSI